MSWCQAVSLRLNLCLRVPSDSPRGSRQHRLPTHPLHTVGHARPHRDRREQSVADGRTVRQSRSWGAFHREIVLDRQLLHAVTCKSLPINEARELVRPCTAVQRPSCTACGADMASVVHAELDMREVLFVNRLRNWAPIHLPPAAV